MFHSSWVIIFFIIPNIYVPRIISSPPGNRMLSRKTISLLFILSACSAPSSFLSVKEKCPQQPKCTCSTANNGLQVDCSGQNFKTVPSNLPRNTSQLILSNNPLRLLHNNSFAHVPLLRWLLIVNASLEHIDVQAFKGLGVLERLSLRNNKGLGIYKNKLQPAIFQCIRILKELFINHNCDSMEKELQYPIAILYPLTELEVLVIDGVSEKPLGSEMLQLRKLHTLGFNGLEGTCNLRYIQKDFFNNTPHLTQLDLVHCNIEYIHGEAFKPLYKIFKLDLSYNEGLGFDGFEVGSKGLANSTISKLFLSKMYPPFGLGIELAVSHMQWLKYTKLTRLEINFNRIEIIARDVLSRTLPKTLKELLMAGNRLSYDLYCFEFIHLPNLQELDISNRFPSQATKHSVLSFDTRCHTACNKTHTNDELTTFSKNNYIAGQLSTWPPSLPPRLTILKGRQMALRYVIPRLTFGDNAVEKIDLHANMLHTWDGPVTGLNRLKWLNLANNFCTNISDHFFHSVPSLQKLLLNQNLLGFRLENDFEGNIFKKLQNLTHLILADNRLQYLPTKIFQNLNNLYNIDLSSNRLSQFNISLRNMRHLGHLDLRWNFISYLPEDVRNDLDHIGDKLKVFLGYNSLVCSCETLPFVKWVSSTKVHIGSKDELTCSLKSLGMKSRPLKDIEEIITILDRSCRSFTPFFITGGGGILLSIIAIFIMTIYRYRWKLRYFYYVSRAKYQGIREPGDRDYKYDAFISYADEDREFVHNELINKLENETGLKLCIHHRDFIPGRLIQDNIAGGIYNSRKCIFMLSKEFFDSHWCQYEFNMARVEEMHSGKDIVILVNLKYVSPRIIPAEIWEQMEVATYITYFPGERNETFWKSIREALKP